MRRLSNASAQSASWKRGSLLGPHWQWAAMCLLAALAFVWGYVGFDRYFAAAGEARSVLGLAYLTLQLFVLESGAVTGAVPWELEAARFLAPIVPAWAVIKALTSLFHDKLQMVRLRFIRGHVVICGLSRKGLQLVREFLASRDRVVVIESDETAGEVEACRELGAIALVGDAADVALLEKARIHAARCLVTVCGDDGTNVEVAVNAHALVQRSRRTQRAPLHCLIQMSDLRLCALFKRHRVFRQASDPFEVRIFNAYENSARLLFEEHPPDAELGGPDDSRRVRLVVIGFGQMGESVALQAAKVGHYANGRKVAVTAVDRVAAVRERDFLARYPAYAELCDASFVEADADDPEFPARVAGLLGEGGAVARVIVCFDDDGRSLSCALRLLPELADTGARILVRMAQAAGLASLLECGAEAKWSERLCAFGMVDRSCTRATLLNEELDVLARAVHEHYVAEGERQGRDPSTDPSLAPWNRLDEDFRDSSRQQADHIPVKLRAIGCRSEPDGTSCEAVTDFSDDEVEMLAPMEHARFVAERRLAGWSYGPEKDVAAKVNPNLVGWDELSEETQNYDRQAVRDIPEILAAIGQCVCRVDGAT